MVIKFLTIYDKSDTEICQVQHELLEFWQKAIVYDQVPFVTKATVEFIDYSLPEYPDQEKLHKEINNKTSYRLGTSQFWQALGKLYTTFDELYAELANTHRLMELSIIIEEPIT